MSAPEVPMSTAAEVRTADAPVSYDPVAKILHWLTVLLLAAQFIVAWTMPAIHRGMKPVGLIGWHVAIGSGLLIVVALRLVWRLTHRAPPPADGLSGWQRRSAAITHWALYVLLLAVPITGWAAASARPWVVRAFGLLLLPPILPTGARIGFEIGDYHGGLLVWMLFGVAVLHILAALYHRLGLRDTVLSRML